MISLLSSETDSEMKELYNNEIKTFETEIVNYDKELEEQFFLFKNKEIEEVIIEIRAGNYIFSLNN